MNLDAIVVGAGVAGLYAVYRLRSQGLTVRGLEAERTIGGSWLKNAYPGARSQIECFDHSYGFNAELQQTWRWSERHATQTEILHYLNHVADRFSLRGHYTFNTSVDAARFDPGAQRWVVATSNGQTLSATYLVLATGAGAIPQFPRLVGRKRFAGEVAHTGTWPETGVATLDKHVAVIGTGQSAVQCIPQLAQFARHVTVLQRSPNFVLPMPSGPLERPIEDGIKRDYPAFRRRSAQLPGGFGSQFDPNPRSALSATEADREREYERRWHRGGLGFVGAFGDLTTSDLAGETAAQFVRGKIRATVKDQATAETLCPTVPFNHRRPCVGIGYYEAFNQNNVTLVDLQSEPISSFTRTGLRVANRDIKADVVVFATGYADRSHALRRLRIHGPSGVSLDTAWAQRPQAHLGLVVHGFPNLFLTSGPGSPSLGTNMFANAEAAVDWIGNCIQHMRSNGLAEVDVQSEAQRQWLDYLSIRGAERDHPGGDPDRLDVPTYRAALCRVAELTYPGFDFTPARAAHQPPSRNRPTAPAAALEGTEAAPRRLRDFVDVA